MNSTSRIGVLILNFGEPQTYEHEEVVGFLERIFDRNSSLESTGENPSSRSKELARRRAPSLIEEYKSMGGSPLNLQAAQQAKTVEKELRRRKLNIRCYSGTQFTKPFIRDAVEQAADDKVEQLVALPIYPLCGKSTTLAALEDVRTAMDLLGLDVPIREVTGWHKHPDYLPMRADNISAYANLREINLHSDDTALVFSAHGTPIKYLETGPRYTQYVEETCSGISRLLGVSDYNLGYQNHTNRNIEWTSPGIEDVVNTTEQTNMILEAVSFMHEQSETKGDLDIELKEIAEDNGINFFRVPIPHDDVRFTNILSDLVENLLRKEPVMGELGLRRCLCRKTPETFCLNATPGDNP